MTVRKTIRVLVDSFHAWHRGTDAATREREKLRKQNRILRQCKSDTERAFVMDACERAPVKDTPGPDANPDVNHFARLARALVENHGFTRPNAVEKVLSESQDTAFGINFGQAVRTRLNNIMRRPKRRKTAPSKAKSHPCRLANNLHNDAPEVPFPREHDRN